MHDPDWRCGQRTEKCALLCVGPDASAFAAAARSTTCVRWADTLRQALRMLACQDFAAVIVGAVPGHAGAGQLAAAFSALADLRPTPGWVVLADQAANQRVAFSALSHSLGVVCLAPSDVRSWLRDRVPQAYTLRRYLDEEILQRLEGYEADGCDFMGLAFDAYERATRQCQHALWRATEEGDAAAFTDRAQALHALSYEMGDIATAHAASALMVDAHASVAEQLAALQQTSKISLQSLRLYLWGDNLWAR
jgi:hypothetical protein